MVRNASFSQISQFTFGLLGSFCSSEAGWTKAQQNGFCREPEAAFGRYCLFDEDSQLCELENNFMNQVSSFVSDENKIELIHSIDIWFSYSRFLAFSIKKSPVFFEEINDNYIFSGLPYFFSYMLHQGLDIRKYAHQTYSEIQKESGIPDLKKISETATWKTLKSLFEKLEVSPAKDRFVLNSVNHYLYLNFCSVIEEMFPLIKHSDLDETLRIYPLEKCHVHFFDQIHEGICRQTEQGNFENSLKITEMNFALVGYGNKILNPSGPEVIREAEKFSKSTERLSNWTYREIYNLWFQTRAMIFSLDLSDKKEVKSAAPLIRGNFKKIFNEGKYLLGDNLKEFLVDAISADVYFDSIETKTIIENTQDFQTETKRSSINLPGKSYWEFAYALGILDENSDRTYLTAYNAEKNFWTNFPVYCFTHKKAALEKYNEETLNREIFFVQDASKFCKTDRMNKLLDYKTRDAFRTKINGHMYNVLSIAIMNHEDKFTHTVIKNFIRENDAEILCLNDECGASPLIRAFYEYKMLAYGYCKEDRLKRSEIYSEGFRAKTKLYSKYFAPPSEKYEEQFEKIELTHQHNILKSFPVEFIKPGKPSNLNSPKNLEITAALKNDIIIPLIKKIGESEQANHLLDEAIEIDTCHCVSALQLAIDSFDFELVELLIKNIPEKDLSKIYISEEYLTPLQYAVRKYDYVMQGHDLYSDIFSGRTRTLGNINRKNIPSRRGKISGGFTKDDYLFLKKRYRFLMSDINPLEECGRKYDLRFSNNEKAEANNPEEKNLTFVCQYSLFKIITELLLEATSKISVQTFYFIADMTESYDLVYDDVIQLTEKLIDSGKADLGGTNFDYTDAGSLPEETLTAHCLRDRKYFFLDFLLNKYPEKFTGILNTLIFGTDDKGYFRIETDLHMFLLNMIESVYNCNEMENGKRKDNFRKQLNLTIKKMLPSFKKAGAKFDIENQDCVTARDLLEELGRLGQGWIEIPDVL